MPEQSWEQLIDAALDARRSQNAYRQRRTLRPLDSTHVECGGRRYVNFASNDYLGLTHHPRVIEAFKNAAQESGVGSGAGALVSGYSVHHAAAERAIANWKGTESAVMLSSGYAANLAAVGAISAIAGESSVRFLLDKLCHASLIDAVRASGNSFRVFPHNRLSKLDRLLKEGDLDQLQVVISESIFSMDGDAADLAGLAELKTKYRFFLLLDEAHGSGVYGRAGSGYAVERGLAGMVDCTVVTLSKAIGVSGGAICGSEKFCQAVVNFGRSYIYSTNIPPALAAAVQCAINVMRDEPHRQQRLRAISQLVRSRLREMSFVLPEGDSPIIPIIIGDENQSLSAAEKLLEAGFLVIAIRPPTVPLGSSRLRITLSCDHTEQEIDRLLTELSKLRRH